MAAPGFSGSNGGITQNYRPVLPQNLNIEYIRKNYPYPLDISYFVNNRCNLKCKHCYVGYEKKNGVLSFKEWIKVFDECINLGGLTFGNVGKEPLLDWQDTKRLLQYFKERREEQKKLRFGFVTNGLLLDENKIEELNKINPDYIDISLDGNEKMHDNIRGKGTYNKLMSNLKLLLSKSSSLSQRVFIIFTINKLNLKCIPGVADIIYNLGLKNLLLSAYVTLNKNDSLYLPENIISTEIGKLIQGNLIDFNKYSGLNIYIKNDHSTTYSLMEQLVDKNIIDKNKLYIDDYGVIFNKYSFNSNNVYFNYLPWDNSYQQIIRISHDGYVSTCYDMFFQDYPSRAIGNVRTNSIREILRGAVPLLAVR